MIPITLLLKPKTAEGKRCSISSITIKEETPFYNQTLDKYQFSTNKSVSKPKFYQQYYQNSNFSRNTTTMSGGRAMTSQSTKNTSRVHTINSFLQSDVSNERIKTQSTLFMACQKTSGRNHITSQISEEPFFEKDQEKDKFEGHLPKNNGVFYEKRRKDNNKFFLPNAPIYSQRLDFKGQNQDFRGNLTNDGDVKKAQKKFLLKKYFDDSDPYKSFTDHNLKEYFKENVVREKSHHHSNVIKKLEGIIIDFQKNEDPFQKNSSVNKQFKINSILHKNPREISQNQLIINQMKPKQLVLKNVLKSNENKRSFLILENLYLDDGNKNRLKYCYTQIGYPAEIRSQKQINEEYEQIKNNLIDYFHLNSREIFLYLKNGTFVKHHYDIPLNEVCLIASGSQRFKGVYNITKNRRKKINILSCFANLEFPIKEFNRLNPQTLQPSKIYEEIIKNNNRELYENTLKMVSHHANTIDSRSLENIYLDLRHGKSRKTNEICEEALESESPVFESKTDYFEVKNLAKTLDKSKHYDKITDIYKFYKREARPSKQDFNDFEVDDEADLQSPIKMKPKIIDLKDVSNLETIANNLDILLEKWQNTNNKNKIQMAHFSIKSFDKTSEDEQLPKKIEYDPGKVEEQDITQNIIQTNVKKFMTKKQYLKILRKKNRELFLQNIPNLINETHLTRKELHTIYILYKALQEVTSQRYVDYNLDDGLDYYTFRNGIYQVFVQSEELAIRIFNTIDFNFSGFLNWEEFLNLMVIIRAKNLKEKIDLFIKIADEDGNGMLSRDEIFKLCKICLSKYINEEERDNFLDDLCEYFTKLIFSAVQKDLTEEIPLNTIKSAIIQGTEESDLLAMFCGADI